ncbi:MAG TPA: MFS transporter [Chloroflexota bacterium]|nr:MFS transporter [Chloroflexota bacterium]
MPRAVWLLSPVLALALLPSNLVATALPLLRTEWGASATALGWTFSAYQLGYVVGVLGLLPLTDRVALPRVIGSSAALSTLAFLLFPVLARDVASASLLRLLAGVGLAGVYLPGVRVVAAQADAHRRGLAVGMYVSAFYLGSALSLAVAGALLPAVGWRGAAWVLGAAQLLGLPLAVLGTREAPGPQGRSARLALGVLRQRPVRGFILAYTGHCWELYTSRGWLAAFLASVLAAAGRGPVEAAAEAGWWAGIIGALGIAGVWLGGALSDRLGRAPTALAIALASGALSLAYGWLAAGGWTLSVTLGCLYGLLVAADSAVYSTAITEVAPPGQVGSAQAVQAAIGFLAAALAPVAGGLALDAGGGYGSVFALAGGIGLVLALPLLPLARAVPRASATAPGP